jgi:EmrB/QacA subfamily drug resistance transporter
MSKEIKIALLMAASLFMDVMDGTIITSALPKLSAEFGVSAASASLLISTYMISVAVFIPLSGWLAARYGKKRTWLIAVILFTLSSVGSAVSVNFAMLLTMRLLQGFAGSLMTPTARLIVLEKTPAQSLLRMMSYLVWPSLVAPAVAPVIGGFLVTYASWHWIFIINLPIGIIAVLIGRKLLPADNQQENLPFDVRGFFELAAASVLILAGFDLLARSGSAVWFGLVGVLFGLIVGFDVFHHLSMVKQPLFSIHALKTPTFRVFQTGGSFFQITVAGLPYILTILLQTVFGWSAARAGWYIMFIFIGNIGIKPFTNAIIRQFNFRGSLIGSFAVLAASSFGLAFIASSTPAFWIMFLALISGASRSMAFTSYMSLQFTEIDSADRNGANTLSAVTGSMAQGLGISLITVVVHLFNTVLTTSQAYAGGFIVLGLFAILPLLEVMTLPKNAGANATQK